METKKTVTILDITYYMICPPISGGALRMIAPYTKMDQDCGLSVDFLFSSYSEEHVASCRAYLEKIPVIRRAYGAICPMCNCFTEGKPQGISPDVYTTMAKELKDKAQELLRQRHYDIIQIEHSQLSWIVPFLRLASPDSKIVLDLHNAEYRIFETWLPYATKERPEIEEKYITMRSWEERVWQWYDAAFTVSPIEEELFRKVSHSNETYLVPTGGGIDPAKYAPKTDNKRPYDLLYLGTMNWFANSHGMLWFLDHVFPIIQQKRPGTKLYIAGFGDPNNGLVKRAIADPNIEFLGQIENDVHYFQNSKVFLVPLWIGAGARVKIPTAWASKIPVVSTTFGAEGAEAVSGENIMLADEPEAFAESVLKLLEDEQFARKIADNAYDTLCKKYTLDRCAEMLVDAYHELAATKPMNRTMKRAAGTEKMHLELLMQRYPALAPIRQEIEDAFDLLRQCYLSGGKLLIAGNGGSCADAEHIVGELMKGFKLPRKLDAKTGQCLRVVDSQRGKVLSEKLQQGLPAIALNSHPALNTAFQNDVDGELAFAQQLGVLGNSGDVFLAISTSGNSQNIYDAALMARAKGLKVIALTGKDGGVIRDLADVSIVVPSYETYQIQELHLPVYHCLCLMLETYFFG